MMQRRNLIAAMGAAFLAGCSRIGESKWFGALVDGAEGWHRGLHRGLGFGRITLAPEFTADDVSPFFRGNGNTEVVSAAWRTLQAGGFANWRLAVTGLVDTPLSLSLADLKALPQRTQITRHDCVEGWSAIAEWTGPQLSAVLAMAGVKPGARFAVFHCADTFAQGPYYESCDMDDCLHPQSVLAHTMNGAPLPDINGAPLRLRLERQLGYKQAKYLTGIELVASLDDVGLGKGGYWEDHHGYQWYAGI
jgi:DMSO/TMAO reductase YedYZ molybdopterin-dependent catalytic subunit